MSRGVVALLATLLMAVANAQEPKVKQGMSIIGDRELPRILYIVPWKKPEPVMIEPVDALEVITNMVNTLDPEVFEHELAYYRHMAEQRRQAEFKDRR